MSPAGSQEPSNRMPGRPRQHELEDASRVAIGAAIPAGWTIEDRRKDYGIDLDVEIFQDREATGLRFAVQVKGKEEVKRRPSVSVKGRTWRYWLSQEHTVLLYLWDAKTGRAWCRWAHNIDPQLLRTGSDTLTVVFEPNEQWTDETPQAIEAEVRARRAFRSPHESLPISVECTGAGTIGTASAGLVVRRVREHLRDHRAVFQLGGGRSDLAMRILIRPATATVYLAGSSQKVLHYEELQEPETARDREWLVRDLAMSVLVMVALQLRQANLIAEAAVLIASVADESSLAATTGLFDSVAILAVAGRMEEATTLVARGRSLDPSGASIALLPILSTPADHQDTDAVLTVLRRWAEEAANGGAEEEAATLAYNTANRARGTDPELAVEMYRQAAALDASYHQRGYWWREIAGALFLSGRFEESADAYAQAVEFGEPDTRSLRGDALLFAGHYGQALTALEPALQSAEQSEDEGRLKAHCARFLVESLGMVDQVRDEAAAWSAWEQSDLGEEAARSAMSIDALCTGALVGLADARRDADLATAELHVLAAFSSPGIPELWVMALAATAVERPEWLSDVATCARRLAGDAILDVLWDTDQDVAQEIGALFKSLPSAPSAPLKVRLTSFGSATYETL